MKAHLIIQAAILALMYALGAFIAWDLWWIAGLTTEDRVLAVTVWAIVSFSAFTGSL